MRINQYPSTVAIEDSDKLVLETGGAQRTQLRRTSLSM